MAEMTWRTENLMLALRITESHLDYQQIIMSASRDGFSATRNSWLDSGDIEQFAEQVHHMWQDLAGAAELVGEHGVDFSVRLTMASGGHVDIDITINEVWGNLQLHARTDQTFLPALHDGLQSLAELARHQPTHRQPST
jgi:hypothetical protein